MSVERGYPVVGLRKDRPTGRDRQTHRAFSLGIECLSVKGAGPSGRLPACGAFHYSRRVAASSNKRGTWGEIIPAVAAMEDLKRAAEMFAKLEEQFPEAYRALAEALRVNRSVGYRNLSKLLLKESTPEDLKSGK